MNETPVAKSIHTAVPIQRDLSSLLLSPEMQRNIEAGSGTYLYGAFLDPMINLGIKLVDNGRANRELVGSALSTIATLYRLSGADYEKQPGRLSGQRLADHQTNVLNGNIILVNPIESMNETNRLAQLQRADETFSAQPHEIQALIAELNYQVFFRPQTMASASETRKKNGLEDLLKSLGKEQAAMPHLTLTNWAIAQIIEGIYKSPAVSELRIIDTGSGPGGTIAAITDRLSHGGKIGIPLAISGIETTQGFYDELKLFVESDPVIANLELTTLPDQSEHRKNISETGHIITVKSDVLTAVQNFDLAQVNTNGVVVITGNYSWHRLDHRTKKAVMDIFALVPNVVFLLGDLANHGNPVAKQYFCLGANGPLNVGNIDLINQFISSGYSMVNLGNRKPSSLNQGIAEKLVHDDKDPEVDGHLWIAYKGDLAERALTLE